MGAAGLDTPTVHYMLDRVLGSSHGSVTPATLYLAPIKEPSLDPATGLMTAAEYTGQARTAVSNDDTNFPPAADRTKLLAVRIDGGDIGTAWDTACEWIGLFKDATGGTPFYTARLKAAKTGLSGSHLYYEVGVVKIASPAGTA